MHLGPVEDLIVVNDSAATQQSVRRHLSQMHWAFSLFVASNASSFFVASKPTMLAVVW